MTEQRTTIRPIAHEDIMYKLGAIESKLDRILDDEKDIDKRVKRIERKHNWLQGAVAGVALLLTGSLSGLGKYLQ